jgi:hypothetical protein
MSEVSVKVSATLCSPNRSVNRVSSNFLFRIWTANLHLYASAARFRNTRRRLKSGPGPFNSDRLKWGNWNSNGPNFSFSKVIRPMNSSNSASQFSSAFVWVTTWGTLAAKMKSAGFYDANFRRWKQREFHSRSNRFRRLEFAGVVGEVIVRFHSHRVEAACPS